MQKQRNRKASSKPPGRNGPRVLAVRMLVAKLSWLDGQLRWLDGRVVWETPHASLAPSPSDLAAAQYALYQLRRYPYAARHGLGDADAWRAERQARLDLAKRLGPLHAAGTDSLAARKPAELAEFLSAEALCADALPGPPSRLLLDAGSEALPHLRRLAGDTALPAPVTGLAALVMGAIHRRANLGETLLSRSLSDVVRRAFDYGRRRGLPGDPEIVARLLWQSDGEALARQWEQARSTIPRTEEYLPLLRGLLADGADPAALIESAVAVAELEPLAKRLLSRRYEIMEALPRERRQRGRELREQRERQAATLAERVREYIRAGGGDPRTVRAVADLLTVMLDLGPASTQMTEMVLTVFAGGSRVPAAVQRGYLGIVTEYAPRLWDKDRLRTEREWLNETRFGAFLLECWRPFGPGIIRLLQATSDPDLARRAASQNLLHLIDQGDDERWDGARYRLLIDVAERLAGAKDNSLSYWIRQVIENAGSGREAAHHLHALLAPLKGVPAAEAMQVLECFLGALPYGRGERRRLLPRLAFLLPHLVELGRVSDGANGCIRCAVAQAALILARTAPEDLRALAAETVAAVAERTAAGTLSRLPIRSLPAAAAVGVAIAAGDRPAYRRIVETMLAHSIALDEYQVQRGTESLARYPGLIAPLRALFFGQPRRCLDLLLRLAGTLDLGQSVLAPLEEARFEEMATARCDTDDPDWRAVLTSAPDLAPAVGAYWYACWLRGETPGVPSGIRKLLTTNEKHAAELAYLEARCAAEPERADLRARVASLRARLEFPSRQERQTQEEIRERLERVTYEAQMAAAESLVATCYRARLEGIVGELPRGFVIDGDMEHAIQLSATVTQNRKPLLRLLRAAVEGDRWAHTRHPANIAFLEKLAAAGVDVTVWTGAHPRRVRCPEAPGGWIHLALENDPLLTLRMGTYFGTCLSAGNINAFSTVANALERNKRVLYVRDAGGNVIGRKLIGITAENALVGFYGYASLPTNEGNAVVRAAMRRYLMDFARRCNLPLVDEGTVPTLFAEAWYDDYAVAWSDEEEAGAARESVHALVSTE